MTTKKKLRAIILSKTNLILELKLERDISNKQIISLISRVDDRDGLIENLEYQISQIDDETEDYRDLFTNSEGDFQDLRVKYMQLKKTVIKEFQRNQRLKSKNDCLAYNLNRTLHDKVRAEKENRKQSMKIRDLMLLKKQLIKAIKSLHHRCDWLKKAYIKKFHETKV